MADGSLCLMQDAMLDPSFAVTRTWDIPNVAALPNEDWGSYLRRIGFTDEQLDYVRCGFSNAAGDSMRFTSAEEILEELADTSDGKGDFRILDGYSHLIEHQAQGLDIHLNTIVKRIDWSGEGVRVETDNGKFEADNIVITLPVGVLQSGNIEFTPPLPAEKQSAVTNICMGPVIKLIYRFEQPIVDSGVMIVFTKGNPPVWWSPSFGLETDQHIWTAFVSGDGARDLLALGETGALEKALDSLRQELNCPDLKALDMKLINWPADPFALGGYSVATPGHANTRKILALPIDNKVFWAGEGTTSGTSVGTVHGAYRSGKRAAAEILANNHQQ
ncbi:MAG: NAD(P)/FAD-dependent oxidoreductase [Chloroflexota bacterium]